MLVLYQFHIERVKKFPTFFNLPDRDDCGCPSPHGRTFPTALDPHFCNRYEMGKFAKDLICSWY